MKAVVSRRSRQQLGFGTSSSQFLLLIRSCENCATCTQVDDLGLRLLRFYSAGYTYREFNKPHTCPVSSTFTGALVFRLFAYFRQLVWMLLQIDSTPELYGVHLVVYVRTRNMSTMRVDTPGCSSSGFAFVVPWLIYNSYCCTTLLCLHL